MASPSDLRPDQPADPLEERRRIEEAFAPLPRCPVCGVRLPMWAMEVIDEGGGMACVPCATGQGRPEVY